MTEHHKPELKISVISDYICPFCFIGHRRLNCLRDDYDLKINWCLVEIHPDTPPGGQPIAMLNYSNDVWSSLVNNLQQLAEEENIQLADYTTCANSRKALLLAEQAKSLGAGYFYPLHERLFAACFIDGLNIGDERVLRNIAEQCNIADSVITEAWNTPHANGPADSTPPTLLPYLQY
ncbi:MAG: DsbA family protein, partial [Gammaproteobacteria bacterium]|nr:DsbA family protein [Gammaproteobacteria bacterium]